METTTKNVSVEKLVTTKGTIFTYVLNDATIIVNKGFPLGKDKINKKVPCIIKKIGTISEEQENNNDIRTTIKDKYIFLKLSKEQAEASNIDIIIEQEDIDLFNNYYNFTHTPGIKEGAGYRFERRDKYGNIIHGNTNIARRWNNRRRTKGRNISTDFITGRMYRGVFISDNKIHRTSSDKIRKKMLASKRAFKVNRYFNFTENATFIKKVVSEKI